VYLQTLEAVPAVRRRRQPLESYLILPVQRIPRYQMLLSDLVKHTSPEHPDYHNLLTAQAKVCCCSGCYLFGLLLLLHTDID
jgi:hypothetical protein